MLLQNLLSEIPTNRQVRVTGDVTDVNISSLAYDSRKVKRNSLFFAIEGLVTDGHLFLEEALARGAVAVASEREVDPHLAAVWIQVPSVRRFMARCANEFFGNPSRKLRLVGVTGTNGKTTTCYLIHSILNQASSALRMGTIDTMVGDQRTPATMTTPEAPDIQKALNLGLEQGCAHGTIEVSSHALHLQRVFGCHFPVAVFTNLSQDHLDFHKDLEEYFRAKLLLFQRGYNPGLRYILTNADDAYGRRLARLSEVPSFSYGTSKGSDICLINHRATHQGLELTLAFFGRTFTLQSQLLGTHNLYNIMAAAAACNLSGIPDDTIQAGIRSLRSVPGRFERIHVGSPFTVILDFAHTPDALENALNLAQEISQNRVICVFGCGGDRDRSKRPLMGKVATEKSDMVIITSDNPRSEDPESIIKQIEQGIPSGTSNFESLPDRKKAILRALAVADEGDLILLAGKGHETYQEVDGQRIHFDEREIIKEAFCFN